MSSAASQIPRSSTLRGILACRPRRAAWVRLVSLGAAFLAAGCSSASRPYTSLLDWQPPAGQPCTPARTALPPSDDLLDAALLLAAHPLRAGSGRGEHLVVAVAYDSTGKPGVVTLLESGLPPQRAETVVETLRSALRPRPFGAPPDFLVRLDSVGVRTGPTEVCRPVLANTEETRQALADGIAAWRKAGGARTPERATFIDFHVDSTGVVVATRLRESSGIAAADRIALDAARVMRFLPARRNGQAVTVWVALPLSIDLGERDALTDATIQRPAALPPPRSP
jgi:TonB family protein